ncbi:MAG TPA: hypothetical protein VFD43_01040 [Planctomycetota bacterium]|nr:hypothetical protein [Planctomycetota bacterium]
MRTLHLLLVVAFTTLVSAPCLLAQEVFETVSGASYTGKLLSNDGAAVEIETASGKMKLPYDSLTPTTQYRLQRAQAGDDGKSQLALAEWCLNKTLYYEARNHYRKALAADPTMTDEINAKVVVARTTAAKELLSRGKALQKEGKFQDARRVWSLLAQELPLEPAAQEARQLLADETAQRKQDALARKPKPASTGAPADEEAPMRASGEPFSEPTVKRFQEVIDTYRKMLDATTDGLKDGGSGAIKEFEKALKDGDRIRKALDKIRPDAKSDEEVSEAVALADSKLEEADVDARLNMVDSYLLRTSYNQAADTVKAGLAHYPQNERLRQAMNRVTAAAADGLGGDWVVVGGRGR